MNSCSDYGSLYLNGICSFLVGYLSFSSLSQAAIMVPTEFDTERESQGERKRDRKGVNRVLLEKARIQISYL